jgi:hypothetical protein
VADDCGRVLRRHRREGWHLTDSARPDRPMPRSCGREPEVAVEDVERIGRWERVQRNPRTQLNRPAVEAEHPPGCEKETVPAGCLASGALNRCRKAATVPGASI